MDTTRSDGDAVQVYLREVCAVPPLTTEEGADLSHLVLTNDRHAESAARRLIEAKLSMVVAIAEQYRGKGMHILDLVQKGNNGLLLALKSFEDNPNTSFSVHAAACVHAAIAKAIADSRA